MPLFCRVLLLQGLAGLQHRPHRNLPLPFAPCPPPQEVVDNLMVGAIEFRTEADPDVAPYTHAKDVAGAAPCCWG